MGFWEWLIPGKKKTVFLDTPVSELAAAAAECAAANAAFATCVNLIANAISRCSIRTFTNGEETHGREYVLWNIEPNVNQNATVFWHKLITKLLIEGEAIIVPTLRSDGINRGEPAWCVADSFARPEIYPSKMCQYTAVTVGSLTYDKTFHENEILHLVLNGIDTKPLIDSMNISYSKLLQIAQRDYTWGHGQHWKVHIDQIAAGSDDFSSNISKMIAEQVKPFFETDSSVLPEFDGYTYERISSEAKDTREIKNIIDDIYANTARAFLIPPSLVTGNVAGVSDANSQFLTYCIDPICRQIENEINRKCYSFADYAAGTRVICDSSTIMHFDIFGSAAATEKAVGSGAFTINDVRRAAGQPVINEDWADRSYMTKNLGPTVTSEGGETNEQNVGN